MSRNARALGAALVASLALAAPAWGQATFQVTNGNDSGNGSLRQAILDANSSAGTDFIVFDDDLTVRLQTALPLLDTNMILRGNNSTVSGENTVQVFFVDQNSNVTFEDMTIEKGFSKGGDGRNRGGGGLGAGGAIFVNRGATVTVDNVSFVNNEARGGNGGQDSEPIAGGGGGGFHGDAGERGGGGGLYGTGGMNGGGGGGKFGDGDTGMDGGNGGGEFEDGAGGQGVEAGAGGAGGEGEGGGKGSTGGAGGRFGGGGASGGLGSGGAGGDFGGGGGSIDLSGQSELEGRMGAGGAGGFGGGGGGGSNMQDSQGGFGAGDGKGEGVGGAGSGLGGAIFVREGGILNVVDGVFDGSNSVTAGMGTGDTPTDPTEEPIPPEASGTGLYLMSQVQADLTVTGTNGDITVADTISGEGGIRKRGPGVLILTGNNDYTGGTTVDQGTLQGTTNSLQGNISTSPVNPSAVVFDQDNNGTYGSVISGGGRLEKRGTGNLSLTGENTYTGGTEVVGGTLRVNTNHLAPGPTNIQMAGTLQFDQGGNGSWSDDITGDGTFRKTGSGRLTVEGGSAAFAGTVLVEGGEIEVINQRLGNGASTVQVRSGATLTGGHDGSGSAGAGGDLVLSGTLRPETDAQEAATFDVGGSLTIESGGTLEIQLRDQDGLSDQIDVSDAATINGGTLAIVPIAGNYTQVLNYTIITTNNGLSPQTPPDYGFDEVQSDFCIFATSLSSNGNDLNLTLTPDLSNLSGCAQTKNQRAVASSLSDALMNDPNDPDLVGILANLSSLTQSQAQDALDAMGGEGLSGFTSARLAGGAQFMRTLSRRMRDTGAERDDGGAEYPLGLVEPRGPGFGTGPLRYGGFGEKADDGRFQFVSLRGESGLGGWLDGFAIFGEVEGDGNSHDSDWNLYGTTAGVDWSPIDGLVLGVSAGYTRTKLSVSDLATWGTGDTYQAGLYGAFSTDWFYLGLAGRYAYTDMETDRVISYSNLYDKTHADFDGDEFSFYAELGVRSFPITRDSETLVQPVMSVLYTRLDHDSYSESGGRHVDSRPMPDPSFTWNVNLAVDDEEIDSVVGSAGLRFYRKFQLDRDAGEFVPELRLLWAREFGDTDREVDARFRGIAAAPGFKVEGAEADRDMAVLGLGWLVKAPEDRLRFSLDYDVAINDDLLTHAVTAGVMVRW